MTKNGGDDSYCYLRRRDESYITKYSNKPIGQWYILDGGCWVNGGRGGSGVGGSGRGISWDDLLRAFSRIFELYDKDEPTYRFFSPSVGPSNALN